MKPSTYMSKNEMIDWLKIGVLAGEARAIAERTPDKNWRSRLNTIATHADKITLERLLELDKDQLESVARRKKTTHMVLVTEDQSRYSQYDKKIVSVAMEDLETITELALCSCLSCQQGECVKDCRFRSVMHKLGMPVARDEVKPGECEFKYNNDKEQVNPWR